MRELLEESFRAAVRAADPLAILAPHLPPRPRGRVFVAAAGKAAASMALAVERAWGPVEGLAITRYGHGLPTQHIRMVEAGHPVPDAAGEAAAREILDKARALESGDLLLVLISGGG
jgi:glycerate-2-kinase